MVLLLCLAFEMTFVLSYAILRHNPRVDVRVSMVDAACRLSESKDREAFFFTTEKKTFYLFFDFFHIMPANLLSWQNEVIQP